MELAVRELKVKLESSKLRETDSLRIIADMQRAQELKKANNQSLLDKLTHQNQSFKDELELIGR